MFVCRSMLCSSIYLQQKIEKRKRVQKKTAIVLTWYCISSSPSCPAGSLRVSKNFMCPYESKSLREIGGSCSNKSSFLIFCLFPPFLMYCMGGWPNYNSAKRAGLCKICSTTQRACQKGLFCLAKLGNFSNDHKVGSLKVHLIVAF